MFELLFRAWTPLEQWSKTENTLFLLMGIGYDVMLQVKAPKSTQLNPQLINTQPVVYNTTANHAAILLVCIKLINYKITKIIL